MAAHEPGDLPEIPSRSTIRMPIEAEVTLEFERFGGFIREMAGNLSLGGMFIQSRQPEPLGTILRFEFRLRPDHYRLIRGRGEVVWVRRTDDPPAKPAGMGIRFLELDAESADLVRSVVGQHGREGGAPFDLDVEGAAPEEPSAEPEPVPGETEPLAPSSSAVPALEAYGFADVGIGSQAPAAPVSWPPSLVEREPESAVVETLAAPKGRRSRWGLIFGFVVLAAGGAAGLWLYRGQRAAATGVPPIAAIPAPATGRRTAAKPKPPPPSPVRSETSTPPPPAASALAAGALAPAPRRSSAQLERVTWETHPGETVLLLWLDAPPSPGTFEHARLEGSEPREIIKLRGVVRNASAGRVVVGTPQLRQVRIGLHEEEPGGALHIVLDLAQVSDRLLALDVEGSRLRARVGPGH